MNILLYNDDEQLNVNEKSKYPPNLSAQFRERKRNENLQLRAKLADQCGPEVDRFFKVWNTEKHTLQVKIV